MTTQKTNFSLKIIPFAILLGLTAVVVDLYLHQGSTTNFEQFAYVFAHGLGGKNTHVNRYCPLFNIDTQANIITKADHDEEAISKKDHIVVAFNFLDTEKGFNAEKVNIGQEEDISVLEAAYQSALKKSPKGVVLTGVSRGAATLLNFAGTKNPSKVHAIIAESSFDTVPNVIKHVARGWGFDKVPYGQEMMHKLLEYKFPGYEKDGICPLKAVQNINKEIPILLVHAKTDELISVNSSRELYLALKACGHQKVYLFELESGRHAALAWHKEMDTYKEVVHAFYKMHNLPHDACLAKQGQRTFDACQPTVVAVEQRIAQDEWRA